MTFSSSPAGHPFSARCMRATGAVSSPHAAGLPTDGGDRV